MTTHARYNGREYRFPEYAPRKQPVLASRVRRIFSSRFARWQWLYQHNPEFTVRVEWLIAAGFGVMTIIAITLTLMFVQ